MQTPSARHRAPITDRRITITFAALTLAGMLAACSVSGSDSGAGSSSTAVVTTTATTTAATATSAAAATTTAAAAATTAPDLTAEEEAAFETEAEWTQCMRDNGIEGLPDPQVNEDGFLLVGFPLVVPEDWNGPERPASTSMMRLAPPNSPPAVTLPPVGSRSCRAATAHCADGSEFAFWERRADPTKVVFFLDGGGACFDATTCAFTGLSAGGERELRLEHLRRRSGAGGRDLRLRPGRQPVRRLQLHLRAVVHR